MPMSPDQLLRTVPAVRKHALASGRRDFPEVTGDAAQHGGQGRRKRCRVLFGGAGGAPDGVARRAGPPPAGWERPAKDSVKLQKFLSAAGAASRRGAEELIKAGRVFVDGSPAVVGARVTAAQKVTLDGEALSGKTRRASCLLAYHKPRGLIVSRAGERTVFEGLPRIGPDRWLSIGRLDVTTEGLLLFTNDGDLANSLAHPGGGCLREYLVLTPDRIEAAAIASTLAKGVAAGGATARPLALALVSAAGGAQRCYRITLADGRNRAVHRIFSACGARVSRLVRFRFGPYFLPPDLGPGNSRKINCLEKTGTAGRSAALGSAAKMLCCKMRRL